MPRFGRSSTPLTPHAISRDGATLTPAWKRSSSSFTAATNCLRNRSAEKKAARCRQSEARDRLLLATNDRTQSAIESGSGVSKNMPGRPWPACGDRLSCPAAPERQHRRTFRLRLDQHDAEILLGCEHEGPRRRHQVPQMLVGNEAAKVTLGPASFFSRSASGPSPATTRFRSGMALKARTIGSMLLIGHQPARCEKMIAQRKHGSRLGERDRRIDHLGLAPIDLLMRRATNCEFVKIASGPCAVRTSHRRIRCRIARAIRPLRPVS